MGDAGIDQLEDSSLALTEVKKHFDRDIIDLDDRVRGASDLQLAHLYFEILVPAFILLLVLLVWLDCLLGFLESKSL